MAMDQSIVVATFTQTTCRMNKRSIANWWKAEIQRWCKDLGRQHLRGSTAAWERRPKTRRRRELTLRQTYAEENSAFKNRRTPLRLIACLLARRPGNAERWLRSTQVNAAGALVAVLGGRWAFEWPLTDANADQYFQATQAQT